MLIKVKVKPNSREQEIIKISDKEYIVRIRNPPTKGKANKELLDLLKSYFKNKKIRIIKGEKSREKVLKIED